MGGPVSQHAHVNEHKHTHTHWHMHKTDRATLQKSHPHICTVTLKTLQVTTVRKRTQKCRRQGTKHERGMANPITVFFQCMELVIKFTHGNNPDMRYVSYPVQLDMKT